MDGRVWLAGLRTPAVAVVVLMLGTGALYASHVRSAAFVYEDLNDVPLTYQPWQGWRLEAAAVRQRPTRALAGALTRLAGFSAPAQHALSLAVFLLVGLAVWQMAQQWLSPWAAVVAAGVWWLSPIQTEAVAYAAARADLLVALCAVLGLWAVCVDRIGWAWLCAVAAVGAKESGVMVLALLPFAAWWRGARWSPLARAGWALSGVVPLLAAWVVTDAGTGLTTVRGLGQALAAVYSLLWRVVWPVGLTLDPPAPSVLAGLLALVGSLLALAWVVGHRRAWLTFAAGWTLLALLPRLVLTLAEGPHAHHLALPMVGLSLAIGYLLVDAPWDARLFQKDVTVGA